MRKTKQDPERKSTADASTGTGQDLYVQWITNMLVFKEVKHCLCSIMEAEVIAGSFSAVEGTWLSQLRKDYNLIFKPILIFTNNEAFISFCKNEVNNN